MNCPVCDDVRMKEIQKDDVLIDVCPACKGVWLDRGELEKLLQGVREVRDDYERMEQQMGQAPFGSPPAPGAGAPAQNQPGFGGGTPAAGQPAPGYGTPSPGYGETGQGGYPPPPAPGSNPGYPQTPNNYGQPDYGQPGYGQQPGQGQYYGHGKYGYDKYGRPYKKKKTVLDVFGDLFD